jgi:hypothetical protein
MKFLVGKTYQTRSIGDADCVFSFEVLKRSAKTITIEYNGRHVRRGVWVDDEGVERCKPCGTYSMCPVIRADRLSV